MIRQCQQCHRAYWRYTRGPLGDPTIWPPGGVCGQLCHELRIDARQARRDAGTGPGIPRAVLELIRSHRRIVHHVSDSTAWFENCTECERLEEKYAAALHAHAQSDPVADPKVTGAAA
jgi:hypothetical protein